MRSVSAAGPASTVEGCRKSSKIYKNSPCPQFLMYYSGVPGDMIKGRSYEVTASKIFSRAGKLYIIASRLKDLSTEKITQLRDSSCMPLSKGRRLKRSMN